MEDTQGTAINFFSLSKKIVELDSLLEGMKEHVSNFKDDIKVYDAIVAAQDSLFRLTQIMRGCEIIIEFAEPLIEPSELFWAEEEKTTKEGHEI